VIAVTVNRSLRTAAAVLPLAAIRTSAHHSFAAEYDEDRLITISGSVTKFEWINPHAMLFVDATDSEGKAGRWKFRDGQSRQPGKSGMEKDGLEDRRPNHRGGLCREGRKQHG